MLCQITKHSNKNPAQINVMARGFVFNCLAMTYFVRTILVRILRTRYTREILLLQNFHITMRKLVSITSQVNVKKPAQGGLSYI